MSEVLDWAGKNEDILLTYGIQLLPSRPMLPESVGHGGTVPVLANEEKDLVGVEWDHSVTTADKFDYEIAACCGLVTGLMDIFFVGELSIDKANEWGQESVENFVIKLAKHDGLKSAKDCDHSELVSKAIRYLEARHHLASDTLTADFGGGLQHHFRDFSHHFSLGGLLCSLITQFSEGKIVIGSDTEGRLLIKHLEDKTFIGKNVQEKIAFGVIEWFYHMASDMAGSSNNPGAGTGIPGPILSFVKRLSTLPFFEDKKVGDIEFRKWLSKLFNGTLLADHDENGKIIPGTQRRFNLQTEIGLAKQLVKQAVPVVINECLVRGLYFVRRLYIEIKDADVRTIRDLERISPDAVLPINNRVVLRMMTIASGTFTAVDFADAGIKAAIKHKGNVMSVEFLVDFAVHVNFAGIGRFAIACCMDARTVREDAARQKSRMAKNLDEYERDLLEMKCLSLSFDQTIALLSIRKLILDYDVEQTKKTKEKRYKLEWIKLWKERSIKGLPVIDGEEDLLFYNQDELNHLIADELRSTEDIHWMFLVALESMMFEPYYALGSEMDEKFENLELESDYLRDVFITAQPVITYGILESYRKAIDHYRKVLLGKKQKDAVKTIGTLTIAAAAGGAAFLIAPAVAPAIATTLFGETLAGLSGAALTSASLAALGGGSLAVGGFGMAGGTAVISGGGALLGLLGGSGITTATSMAFLSDEGYVLQECIKLLTYCKEVLIDLYHNTGDVRLIAEDIREKLADLSDRILDIEEADSKGNKEKKQLIALCKRSLKYLSRTEAELIKMIEKKEARLEQWAIGGRETRINILKDTELIMKKGWYRVDGKPKKLKLSREEYTEAFYISEEDIRSLYDSLTSKYDNNYDSCICYVKNDDSYSVAMDIMMSSKFITQGDARVLVLNFANSINPGGGVRRGASAQEEDLCRKSTLLASIESEAASPYYFNHKKMRTAMASDAVILSPNVEIIRDRNNDLLDDSKVVAVITSAAPNLRFVPDASPEILEEVFYNRIMAILKVAAYYGYRFIVLGAFGCGAFGNDADLVSYQFRKVLEDINVNGLGKDELFDEIAFAVLDKSDDQFKYNAFIRNIEQN